jgi:hypothetical protein
VTETVSASGRPTAVNQGTLLKTSVLELVAAVRINGSGNKCACLSMPITLKLQHIQYGDNQPSIIIGIRSHTPWPLAWPGTPITC